MPCSQHWRHPIRRPNRAPAPAAKDGPRINDEIRNLQIQLIDQNGTNVAVTLPTNKGVIASRLNLTQEHFSRILHELFELGLIVVEGRKIHIPSVANLRKHEG